MTNKKLWWEEKAQKIVDLFFDAGARVSKSHYDSVYGHLFEVDQRAREEERAKSDRIIGQAHSDGFVEGMSRGREEEREKFLNQKANEHDNEVRKEFAERVVEIVKTMKPSQVVQLGVVEQGTQDGKLHYQREYGKQDGYEQAIFDIILFLKH